MGALRGETRSVGQMWDPGEVHLTLQDRALQVAVDMYVDDHCASSELNGILGFQKYRDIGDFRQTHQYVSAVQRGRFSSQEDGVSLMYRHLFRRCVGIRYSTTNR